MVDRLILGRHNGAFWARLSRPGFDVKTASLGQLLMTDVGSGRIVQYFQFGSASILGPGNTSVAWTNRGVVPYVFICPGPQGASTWTFPEYDVGYRNVTAGGCDLLNENSGLSVTIYYFVMVI